MKFKTKSFKTKSRNERHGAAIVEMAICFPLLVLLTFGTIETAGAIFLKQTITSAAHEGALLGMRSDATETQVRERVELILTARNVGDCVITVTPSGADFDDLQSGDTFTIDVAKDSQNSFINLSAVSASVSSKHP